MQKEVQVVEDGEVTELYGVIKLTKPYTFEGNEYTEVDLSGLENITARDMIEANKIYDRSGGYAIMPELSMEYALVIASRASKHPVEFFYGLPPRDAINIKNGIISFFFRRD